MSPLLNMMNNVTELNNFNLEGDDTRISFHYIRDQLRSARIFMSDNTMRQTLQSEELSLLDDLIQMIDNVLADPMFEQWCYDHSMEGGDEFFDEFGTFVWDDILRPDCFNVAHVYFHTFLLCNRYFTPNFDFEYYKSDNFLSVCYHKFNVHE